MHPHKYTIEDMREIARRKGGKCLSKTYEGVRKTKLEWQCHRKHKWESFAKYINAGHWCPRCVYDERALGIEAMQKLANLRGGKCLSKKYFDHKTKLNWECKEGHRWESTPSNAKKGSWCPHCRLLTIESFQDIAKSRGGKCLSEKYLGILSKHKWECKEGHQWESTANIVKNGHWCPKCWRVGKMSSLEDLQETAKSRGGKCLAEKYLGMLSKHKWECKEGHQWEATSSNVQRGSWCPSCAGLIITIEDLKKLAQQKGGKCLSRKYISCHSKLKWECHKKHRWETTQTAVKIGKWCPTCARLSYTLTIEEMHEVAKNEGGKCLSERYTNTRTKLLWQCNKGHQWMAQPSHVKEGRWCSVCSKLARKKERPEVEHNTIPRILKSKLMSVPKEAKALKRKLEKNDIYIGS